MDCFEYPIDSKYLLRKKHQIKKELCNTQTGVLNKKIAVLGGSTTNEVVDQLELFLLHYGISTEFYQSDYGQYWQDAMFSNEKLDSFKPDLIYIHTNWRNISKFPTVNSSKKEIDDMLENEIERYTAMWDTLADRFHCPIIQNNFERPNYRLLGNRDISDVHGRANFISRLNQKIYEYAETHPDFFVNDIEYLSADYGLSAWSDSRYWHMYKYAMSLEAIPALASSIAIIIKAIYGKNKKVLALDLDNTLWGGVIGDDGVEGIDIGPETSKGQVYYEFQEYCKNLKSIGVLLTIVSKNEEQNALDGLNHSDGVLRPDDFVSIKANWEAKNINIRDMAEELTLGEDSFVFVDDNPAERDIVNQYLPKVSTPDIRTAEQYIYVLDHTGYFEVISLSDEDVKKTELYQAKAKANHEKTAFANYDEYLKSLDMVATIKPFEQLYYQRIAQLTNKSNQFNLTTVRCSVDEIETMANDKNYITLYGKLQDKFGDNGLVTVIAGECIEDSLHIRLWLMSCRVLKRGLEDSMMNSLVELSQKRGMKKIVGYYYPTEKNQMVSDFFEKYGFRLIDKKQKETVWLLDVSDYQRVKVEMTVKSD